MKKLLSIALVVVLLAGIAVTGTMAYLSDTDSDVNVMTLGKVDIDQIEQERDANGSLVTFKQAKPAYPAVGPIEWATKGVDVNGTEYKVFTPELKNVVDKIVTVKNTGKSDAYVRTIVAIEAPDYDPNDLIHINYNSTGVTISAPVTVEIDGVDYVCFAFTYDALLAAGATSAPSLMQLFLDSKATSEDVAKFGDTWEVLVLSQAVQAEGFADAQTALNAGFGEANATNAAAWFGGVLEGQDFAGGAGTEDAPYLINDASQLMNISNYADYTYFKVADGVETLDLTGVGKIKLNGSFDGNGVTMNNLSTALFQSVGTVDEAQDIKIANFTANVNTTDGNALVRNIYNPGTTTFENVTLHGYIEGQYNMGSFYNYGTANAGTGGANYTVSFVNAQSDVTLVCTTGNVIGGMLGHGYEGADYKLSINMDADSGYTGKMYTTAGGNNCYQVMALCSHATYILNGVETSRSDNKYPSTKLNIAAPIVGEGGYYVAPADGVHHYVVSLEAQLTAYDENNVKIPNLAGLTWSLGKTTITTGFDGKIFDLVNTGEIVNDANHEIGYELSGGDLKVYSGRDTNYKSGWITLLVTQYDAGGEILATGNVRVFTFAEPTANP